MIVTAALAAGLGLVAVGCSAGQVTQTDTQVAAIDGASGNVGPIAVRNVMLAFPPDGNRYHEGDDVPLTFVIANTGENADKLLSIKSEAAEAEAEVVGGKDIPSRYALQAEYDASKAPTKTSAPSSGSARPVRPSHAPSSLTRLRRSRRLPASRRPRRPHRLRARARRRPAARRVVLGLADLVVGRDP